MKIPTILHEIDNSKKAYLLINIGAGEMQPTGVLTDKNDFIDS